MVYSIFGLQQKKLVELSLTTNDALILKYIAEFIESKKMVSIKYEGKNYYWVDYKTLIEKLPILGLKKDSLYRRLKAMVKIGVLKHYTKKQGGTFSFYSLGDNYYSLLEKEDNNSTPSNKEKDNDDNQKNNHKNNNNNNNHNNKNNNKNNNNNNNYSHSNNNNYSQNQYSQDNYNEDDYYDEYYDDDEYYEEDYYDEYYEDDDYYSNINHGNYNLISSNNGVNNAVENNKAKNNVVNDNKAKNKVNYNISNNSEDNITSSEALEYQIESSQSLETFEKVDWEKSISTIHNPLTPKDKNTNSYGLNTKSSRDKNSRGYGLKSQTKDSLNKYSLNKNSLNKHIKNIVENVVSYLNIHSNNNFSSRDKNIIKLISKLIKEGYKESDLKHVINIKSTEWIGTKFWEYLRPSTLFGEKFYKYVTEKFKGKGFNNFQGRDYDFYSLERQLLGWE